MADLSSVKIKGDQVVQNNDSVNINNRSGIGQILNGIDDYADNRCGSNPNKYMIAFADDHMMKPLCSKIIKNVNVNGTTTNETSIDCDFANKVICAYPYVGPLSIQNNANFCEDGFEPSIWTNPKLPLGLGQIRDDDIGLRITKIDDSSNVGKPV